MHNISAGGAAVFASRKRHYFVSRSIFNVAGKIGTGFQFDEIRRHIVVTVKFAAVTFLVGVRGFVSGENFEAVVHVLCEQIYVRVFLIISVL